MEYGIGHLGIIPLRKENSHKSEMVSQLLYGEAYKVIEKRKDWCKVRLEWDSYEGWVDRQQIYNISKQEYEKLTLAKLKVSNDLVNYVTTQEKLIFPILMGADLRGLKLLQHQFEGEALPPKKLKKALAKTAYLFLNTPYLWGGRTLMGIDCSGFTQMVYKINGIPLYRDAYQQATQGQTLSFIEESEAGDLAFFDDAEGHIKHVGLLLENHHIIHAFGRVRIDRIDQSGIFNLDTQSHTHSLRFIKKMI